MTDQINRREFTRVFVKLEAELLSGGYVVVKGRLENVSYNGMFLRCDTVLPVGTQCQVGLVLAGGAGARYVQARGVVSRIEKAGLAVQFTEILGEESAAHLKNLVLYNSQDKLPQIQQEFQTHLGLKARD